VGRGARRHRVDHRVRGSWLRAGHRRCAQRALLMIPMDVAGCVSRLRERFDGIDALLVTRLANIRYLTGFTGSAARLLVGHGELARIEEAARRADAALAQVRSRLADGITEKDFQLELDHTMRRLGAADVSFETIVASGPNGAKPHHRPSTRHIVEGDLVVLDFGALVDGYHSD